MCVCVCVCVVLVLVLFVCLLVFEAMEITSCFIQQKEVFASSSTSQPSNCKF